MTPPLSTLVEELLALDPTLTPKRAEVELLVADILRLKPEAPLREEFKQELLLRLQAHLSDHSVLSSLAPRSSPTGERSGVPFPSIPMLKRFFFFGGGALAGVLAAVLFITLPKGGMPPAEISEEPNTVTSLDREAFGALTSPSALSARPQSGGGGGEAATGVSMDAKRMAEPSMILPPGEFTIVEYAYAGEITLPESDIDVLRRRQHDGSINVSNIFASSALSRLFNIEGLGNLRTQQIALTQEGNDPLALSIDFLDGSIWINRSVDYRDRPDAACRDEACFQQFRLKESDMLSMEELTGIARAFIAELGIDTSSYGEPQVLDDWQTWYALAENTADYYFPEMQTVVLPLLINGKPVFEEYGEPYGLTFSIDVRRKEVMSVGNLRTHAVESSSYAGVSDMEKVQTVIRQGGSPIYWMPEGAKKVEALLDAPVEAYLHSYQWNETDGTSKELFVPALAFSVREMPKEGGAKKRVVIPLAAEIVDRILSPDVNGMPMPLMEKTPVMEDLSVPEDDAPTAEGN